MFGFRLADVLLRHLGRAGQGARTIAGLEAEEAVDESKDVPWSIGEVGGQVVFADHDHGVVVRICSGRVTVQARRGMRKPSGRKHPMPVENGVTVTGHPTR